MLNRFWVLLERPNLRDSLETDTTEPGLNGDIVPKTLNKDSFYKRLTMIPSLFKYMIPLSLVYLFEYLINQGLVSILHTNEAKSSYMKVGSQATCKLKHKRLIVPSIHCYKIPMNEIPIIGSIFLYKILCILKCGHPMSPLLLGFRGSQLMILRFFSPCLAT